MPIDQEPRPVFNLKRLGLGDESRDLGVQFSGPGT
jgi:hypothetical protein